MSASPIRVLLVDSQSTPPLRMRLLPTARFLNQLPNSIRRDAADYDLIRRRALDVRFVRLSRAYTRNAPD